jgi:hypothetical protein
MRQERATVLVLALVQVQVQAPVQRLALVPEQQQASAQVLAQVSLRVPVRVQAQEPRQARLLAVVPQVQLHRLTHRLLRSRFQLAPSPLLERESPSAFRRLAREPRCQLCRSKPRTTARRHAPHRRPS